MSLGKKIIALRKQKNWKQKDLADRLGITARQLVRWELDQVHPRPKAIEQLAHILGVQVEDLTVGTAPSDKHIEDRELQQLLSYIPELDAYRLEGLKRVLRDIVTCHQFDRFRSIPQIAS
jgi:transcriptional regulator with XRE-family HTH domain